MTARIVLLDSLLNTVTNVSIKIRFSDFYHLVVVYRSEEDCKWCSMLSTLYCPRFCIVKFFVVGFPWTVRGELEHHYDLHQLRARRATMSTKQKEDLK